MISILIGQKIHFDRCESIPNINKIGSAMYIETDPVIAKTNKIIIS